MLTDRLEVSAAGGIGAEWPLEAFSQPYSFGLLGRFQARRAGGEWLQLEGRRLQEIVSYLLLFRNRPHQREVLAGTLLGSGSGEPRKRLRHQLWLLQEGRGAGDASGSAGEPERLLLVERDWVQINRRLVWLDVARLESAFELVRSLPGELLTAGQAASVMRAVDLYRGDLLEGWEQPWCVYERERLGAVHLCLLEKLLGYFEAKNRPEEGIYYGERLLQHDRAHERAHWRMMRLYHRAGDRTGALRQFERCRSALADELGIEPARPTLDLYRQLRDDREVAGQPR